MMMSNDFVTLCAIPHVRPSLGWFLDLTTSLAMSSTDEDPESEFSNRRPRGGWKGAERLTFNLGG